MLYPTTRKKNQQSQHSHSVRFFAETAVLKGQVVTLGTEDTEVIPSTADDVPLGIALNSVSAADIAAYAVDSNSEHVACEVAIHGMVPVLAGAALTMGQMVKSDANGRLVPVTGGVVEYVVGKMYNVAAANGDATHMWIHMYDSKDAVPA